MSQAARSWAERGLVPTVIPYGYRQVPGERGRLAIHEPEAAVVRLAFRLRADGASCAAIAETLNARALPKANGKPWLPSRVRHMLENSLYRGTIIFGRTRHLIGEDGRRTVVPLPRAEWLVSDVPDLRIVDPRVGARADAVGDPGRPAAPGPGAP